MGEALLGGLLAAGWAEPSEVRVVEQLPARRAELAQRFPGVVIEASIGPAPAAVVVVKPNDVPAACHQLAAAGQARRVLSVAAGVTTAAVEGALCPTVGGPRLEDVAVVRAMPNTPALVGEGASAIAGGSRASDADLDWAE